MTTPQPSPSKTTQQIAKELYDYSLRRKLITISVVVVVTILGATMINLRAAEQRAQQDKAAETDLKIAQLPPAPPPSTSTTTPYPLPTPYTLPSIITAEQFIATTVSEPPLVVASNQQVANLNASFLEGHNWQDILTLVDDSIPEPTATTLEYTLTSTDVFKIQGSGSVTFNQSGTTTFASPVSLTGNVTVGGSLSATNKLDLGNGTHAVNVHAATLDLRSASSLNLRPNNDTDDYIYLSTLTDQPGIFFAGTASNDPGIRLNSTTGKLEYRDDNSTTWQSFDGLSTGSSSNLFTGNVGIGTTNPSYSLDVAGAINSTAWYLNGAQVNATATQLNLLVGRSGTLLDTNDLLPALPYGRTGFLMDLS